MPPLQDFDAEAKRIIDAAEAKGIVLRLFGGVSFLLRCPSAKHRSLRRDYLDLDFLGHSKQSREISRLFKELGYVPRELFNARLGYQRLIFNDIENNRRVDIFLDVFEMCHKFNFKKRLEIDRYTLPLADMLATKLQIVEINEKDVRDILSVFLDYDVGSKDTDTINGAYIANLCASDWGIYKTFTLNLGKVLAMVPDRDFDAAQKEILTSRVGRLIKAIEDAPKSLKWQVRAAVGERVRWYELPEADVGVVDSRVTPTAVFSDSADALGATVVGIELDQGQKDTVKARAEKLLDAIESAPRSLVWTMRSTVGERVRWYLLPDSDFQIVDSRIAKEDEQRPA